MPECEQNIAGELNIAGKFRESISPQGEILSPNSSFISTYMPDHTLSTSLDGNGLDPEGKHIPPLNKADIIREVPAIRLGGSLGQASP